MLNRDSVIVMAQPQLPCPAELDDEMAVRFAGSDQLGLRGFMDQFQSPTSGVMLRTYFWPAVNAKGVVLLAHGHGSYCIHDYLRPTVWNVPISENAG